MKKVLLSFLTIMTILMIGGVKVSADSTQSEIYRLYNKNTGEHFYTSSAFERDSSVNQAGLTKEWVGFLLKNLQLQFTEYSIPMLVVETTIILKVIMKLLNS